MGILSTHTEGITQGTVIDGVNWNLDPSPLSIVLSNPCDLDWDKASFLLVAALLPAHEIIQSSKEFQNMVQNSEETIISKKKYETLSKYVEQFILNVNISRYFFIDTNSIIDVPPFFVDFQFIRAVPIEQRSRFYPVAELRSPYREKLIVHFSSYISRIGVDRPEQEQKGALISKMLNPYTTD